MNALKIDELIEKETSKIKQNSIPIQKLMLAYELAEGGAHIASAQVQIPNKTIFIKKRSDHLYTAIKKVFKGIKNSLGKQQPKKRRKIDLSYIN